MPPIPPSPFWYRVKGSYFGECERDDEGHCLPSGQQEESKPKPPGMTGMEGSDGPGKVAEARKEDRRVETEERREQEVEHARNMSRAHMEGERDAGLREFRGRKEADEWGVRSFSKWAGSLSDEEEQAVSTYTSAMYGPINRGLRDGDLDKEDAETVKRLDGILSRGKVPEDMIVFRGISDPEVLGDLKGWQGKIFEDRAYVSTTLAPEIAERFADAALFRIRVPKGAKAGYIGAVFEEEDGGEQELLLPRGTKIKINGYGEKEGRVVIEAEVILD